MCCFIQRVVSLVLLLYESNSTELPCKTRAIVGNTSLKTVNSVKNKFLYFYSH